MKQRFHKIFFVWQFEKEEKWLNEMARQGLALTDVGFCRYDFEDCEPGKYQFHLELLEQAPNHPKSRDYIQFIEESGAEHIGSLFRWVYFRKEVADGGFEIYSDLDSRIRYLKSINNLMITLLILNLFAGLYNLFIGITFPAPLNAGIAIPVLLLSAFLSGSMIHLNKVIGRLKREREIHE